MKSSFFSPIDEFEIHPIFLWFYPKINSFIPLNFMFFFILFFLLFSFNIFLKSSKLITDSNLNLFFEEFYLFINRLILQNYKLNGQFTLYFPFIFFLFFFILFTNLLGLVPGGFTNTAFIIHNFLITLSIITGLTLMGLFNLGLKTYIKFFIIQGLSTLAQIFLFILEIISHIAKAFSLSIRLFANMTAGHTLMHILGGGIINIFKIPFLNSMGLVPLLIFILVCLMELGIAILQSYVFIILVILYFNENLQTTNYQKKKKIYNYDFSEKFFDEEI